MNSLKALERYTKLKEGKSLKQIAEEENVTIQTVDRSIRDFSGQRLMDLRAKIERDNSKLRRKIQSELSAKYVHALSKLLDGKREEVHYDSKKGEFVKTEVVDINLLIEALEAYRKSTSLEEKPAPSSTVVNVQQNNMNEPSESFRFEDRIEMLKARHKIKEESFTNSGNTD